MLREKVKLRMEPRDYLHLGSKEKKASEKKAETREGEMQENLEKSWEGKSFKEREAFHSGISGAAKRLKRLHLVAGSYQYLFERQILLKGGEGSQVTDNKGMGKCSTESRLSLHKLRGWNVGRMTIRLK